MTKTRKIAPIKTSVTYSCISCGLDTTRKNDHVRHLLSVHYVKWHNGQEPLTYTDGDVVKHSVLVPRRYRL